MPKREVIELTRRGVMDLLGIGDDRMRKFQRRTDFPHHIAGGRSYDAREIVEWWVSYNVGEAVGIETSKRPGTTSKINESDERARYYRARADFQERQNAIEAGEFVSAEIVSTVLEQPVKELCKGLDALPVQIKNDLPHLNAHETDGIKTRIARLRNQFARFEFTIPHAA